MSSNSKKAVSFAASMIRKGEYIGKAIKVAAAYYNVAYEDVQKGLAARSGRSRKGQAREPNKAILCECCAERNATWRLRIMDGYADCGSRFLCDTCRNNPRLVSDFYSHQSGVTAKWTRYVVKGDSMAVVMTG